MEFKMKILVKNYGTILTSRPAGREAALVMKNNILLKKEEKIKLDFEGVLSVGPSWLDEVLTALRQEYGKDRILIYPSQNP